MNRTPNQILIANQIYMSRIETLADLTNYLEKARRTDSFTLRWTKLSFLTT